MQNRVRDFKATGLSPVLAAGGSGTPATIMANQQSAPSSFLLFSPTLKALVAISRRAAGRPAQSAPRATKVSVSDLEKAGFIAAMRV